GFEFTEALRVQMEVQRRSHEQLKVQQLLQLHIKSYRIIYNQSLEKACKALNDQAIATAGLDAAREELSYLAIKVPNECPPSITLTSSLTHLIAHIKNEHAQNVNSCLSSQADAVKKRQRGETSLRSSFANEAVMGWLSSIYDDYFTDMECLKEHGGDLIMSGPSVIFMWLVSFLNIDGSLEQVFYFEDMSGVLCLNYCHSSLVLNLVYIAKVVSSMVGSYGSYNLEWVVYFLRYDERPYERILLDTLRIGSNIQEQSGMDSFILED
ncbi:PHR1-LIKE 2-like protein, partial [Tanacetum coccineum]